MRYLATISLFVFRLLFTSVLALAFQIFLIVRHPDYLLVVQEAVGKLTVVVFQVVELASSYKVAYNLINGDGIVVHTFFVLMAFLAISLLLLPLKLLKFAFR